MPEKLHFRIDPNPHNTEIVLEHEDGFRQKLNLVTNALIELKSDDLNRVTLTMLMPDVVAEIVIPTEQAATIKLAEDGDPFPFLSADDAKVLADLASSTNRTSKAEREALDKIVGILELRP